MKKSVKLMSILMALVMVLSACGGKTEEANGVTGTYEGKAKGHNGDVVLEVEFKNSKIEKITVKSSEESAGIGDKAIEKLTEEVIANNTVDVDTVAAATVTSNAFIDAVKDAITNAGLKVEDFAKAADKEDDKEEDKTGETKEVEKDVVVVGAGGAGLVSAIKAKEEGADVIVLEKMPVVGGNTLISGAEYAAPGNWLQEKEGIEDSKEDFAKDVEKAGGDKDLIKVLADNALAGAEWLRDEANVEWTDELMFFGGHSVKRSLIPKGQSGSELITKLNKKAEDLGIEILTDTEAYELLAKDGTITGLKAKTKDGELVVNAKSVILTSGGFGANAEMCYENDKEVDDKIHSTNAVGSTGDGIKMAEAVGAATVGMEHIQLYPVCDVETGRLLYTGDTRLAAGALLVNKEGKRFVEELDTRRAISMAIKAQTDSVAYQIWDEKSAVESGMMDHENEAKDLMERGLMVKADTIEEAAKHFGIDEKALVETVNHFNEMSEAGEDKDFNLRRLGFTVDKAPFYIIKASPAVHHTMGGVKIDTDARVIDTEGNVIKGLYAAGEVTGGIHGENRLGSVAIADITVFGLIAGENAAAGK